MSDQSQNQTVQPSDSASKLMDLLKSRKFWAALVGLAIVVTKAFRPDFPLDETQVTNLVYVIVAYILGTGLSELAPR